MKKKNVLILCTGNSCRSIMAEALINAKLGNTVFAQSSGVDASGRVNPIAKALLQEHHLWREEYHSKTIDTVIESPFDLIVTVCDHANEACPMFPKAVKTIHMGLEDPSGKEKEEYVKALELIHENLLPIIQKELL